MVIGKRYTAAQDVISRTTENNSNLFLLIQDFLFLVTLKNTYSMMLFEDIEGIRKYLKIERMVVMGNSMLAIIALEYAKKYPERVSHLVMIGISPIFDDSYYKERNKYWESQATEERKQIWEENKKKLTEKLRKEVSPGKARVLRYVSKRSPNDVMMPDTTLHGCLKELQLICLRE